MGCACGGKNRQTFEVVTEGGAGRTVFTTHMEATAKGVAARYPGSVARNKATGEVVYTAPAAKTTPGAKAL